MIDLRSVVWRGIAASMLLVAPVKAAEPTEKATPIDRVTKSPARGVGLGTIGYAPSKAEKPFFDKLEKDEQTVGSILPGEGDYDIHAKDGKYIGWFGIVREIAIDKDAQTTTLLVEHKYFDGLTDAHIQALSFNGSGDFQAVLQGADTKIDLLSLVKVYGKAAVAKPNALPRVDAVFVRNWSWGAFTFLDDYGEQRGSANWRKLNTVELDDIYEPYPRDEYYLKRLGSRPDEKQRGEQFRARAMRAAIAAHPGSEALVGLLVDALTSDGDLEAAVAAATKAHAFDVAVVVLAECLTDRQIQRWPRPRASNPAATSPLKG